jgi:hypothetical protein
MKKTASIESTDDALAIEVRVCCAARCRALGSHLSKLVLLQATTRQPPSEQCEPALTAAAGRTRIRGQCAASNAIKIKVKVCVGCSCSLGSAA